MSLNKTFSGDVVNTGGGTVTTISTAAVSLAKQADLAAGVVIGRSVSAATGVPTALTGAQQGENVRYTTVVTDTTSTGAQTTYSSILTTTTQILCNTTGEVEIQGIAVPNPQGQRIVFHRQLSATGTWIFRNNSGSAGATQQKLVLNLARDHYLLENQSIEFEYTNNRWRHIGGTAMPLDIDSIEPIDLIDENFDRQIILGGGVGTVTADTIYGDGWHVLSGQGTNIAARLTPGVLGHIGTLRLTTATTSGDNLSLLYTRDFNDVAAGASTDASIDLSHVYQLDMWVRIPTITTMGVRIGLAQDGIGTSFGTASISYIYSAAAGTDWKIETRTASTSTTTNTAVTVVAGTWYKLTIVRNSATSYGFYVNNTAINTNITSNVPTADMVLSMNLVTNTTAARDVDIDRWRVIGRDDALRQN